MGELDQVLDHIIETNLRLGISLVSFQSKVAGMWDQKRAEVDHEQFIASTACDYCGAEVSTIIKGKRLCEDCAIIFQSNVKEPEELPVEVPSVPQHTSFSNPYFINFKIK